MFVPLPAALQTTLVARIARLAADAATVGRLAETPTAEEFCRRLREAEVNRPRSAVVGGRLRVRAPATRFRTPPASAAPPAAPASGAE